MFFNASILTLLCIIFLEETTAYIIIDSVETVYIKPKYLAQFDTYLSNARTTDAELHIDIHVTNAFPNDSIFLATAYSSFSGLQVFEQYSAEICNPNTEFGNLPQYLEDLTENGVHCILEGTQKMLKNAGFFDIELLISNEEAKYWFPLTNINTISSGGEVIVQYKITATNHVDEDIEFD